MCGFVCFFLHRRQIAITSVPLVSAPSPTAPSLVLIPEQKRQLQHTPIAREVICCLNGTLWILFGYKSFQNKHFKVGVGNGIEEEK